jgi:hypothetical protein
LARAIMPGIPIAVAEAGILSGLAAQSMRVGTG